MMTHKGNPASRGRAQGRARVIGDAQDAKQVQAGEVLITRMTTPDMVPAMRRCAAIVTAIGGRTCHAAIVSREFGKPCVVAVADALSIPNGALVSVDGAAGIVVVH